MTANHHDRELWERYFSPDMYTYSEDLTETWAEADKNTTT